MLLLGIDPGTQRVGYGLVRKNGSEYDFVDAGILLVRAKETAAALQEVKKALDEILSRATPAAAVVERLFFSKNQKTAIQVAQARGVILLCLAERGIPILECTPNEAKAHITGYGGADKKAVAKMVAYTLRIPPLRLVDDAIDALALAIVGGGILRLTS